MDLQFLVCLWPHIPSPVVYFNLLFPRGAGATPRPQALSVRVIAVVWWLFTLALLAAYIANFTALLSSGSEQLPIQTFEDLVKQRNLEFGTLEGSSTFYYFKVQRISWCPRTGAVELLRRGWVTQLRPCNPYNTLIIVDSLSFPVILQIIRFLFWSPLPPPLLTGRQAQNSIFILYSFKISVLFRGCLCVPQAAGAIYDTCTPV